MTPDATDERQQRRAAARVVLHSAPVALLFGAAAAALAFGVARLAGAPMIVPVDAGDPASQLVRMPLSRVLIEPVLPAFGGAIVLSLLARTARPLPWFAIVTCAFVFLATRPLLFPREPGVLRIDAATRLAVASIHGATALAVAWTLARSLRARAGPPRG